MGLSQRSVLESSSVAGRDTAASTAQVMPSSGRKPVPRMVSALPPLLGPESGEISVSNGRGR